MENFNLVELVEPKERAGIYPIDEMREIYNELGRIIIRNNNGDLKTLDKKIDGSDFDKILDKFHEWLQKRD